MLVEILAGSNDPTSPPPRNAILAMFDAFRETLDEQNDRFERLVKLSRDLTIQSKRIIFLLHRVAGQYSIGTSPISVNPSSPASTDAIHDDASPLPESARAADLEAVKQAQQKFEDLKPLFAKIANELVDQEADRYMRAISPGLQEFLEAFSFAYYLEHDTLVTYEQVQGFLTGIPLSQADYLLGISDLSGELMRFAISAASMRGGRKQKVAEVCLFVRACWAGFEPLAPFVKGLGKKQQVTSESLKKIEKAAYAIALRAAEYPDSDLQSILLEPDAPAGKGRRTSDDFADMNDY